MPALETWPLFTPCHSGHLRADEACSISPLRRWYRSTPSWHGKQRNAKRIKTFQTNQITSNQHECPLAVKHFRTSLGQNGVTSHQPSILPKSCYIWKLSLLVSQVPFSVSELIAGKELHKKHSTLTFAKHLSSLCPAKNCTPHLSRHFNSVLAEINLLRLRSHSSVVPLYIWYFTTSHFTHTFASGILPLKAGLLWLVRCNKIPLRSKGPDLNMQRRPRSETSTGLSQSTSSTECLGMNFVRKIGAHLVRDCCPWQVPCAICN